MTMFYAGQSDYIAALNALADGLLAMAAAQTTDFTAVAGSRYPLNANALTVTLPGAPADGQMIGLFSATSSVVSATLNRNGNNIDSAAANVTLSGGETSVNVLLIYVNSTIGWRVIRASPAIGLEVKTTGFTAVKNTFYAIDASTFTVTLPSSPAAGDTLWLAATTPARTAITLGRAGSNINSAAADYTINAQQWAVEIRYVNSTVGWLVVYHSTEQALARWDATTKQLRYYDGQRELAAPVGWLPFAFPLGGTGGDLANQNTAPGVLAASGGSVAIPVHVTGHMLLKSVSLTNSDSSLTRTAEWRLYRQAVNNGNTAENTLDEVASANGTWSFTAAGSAVRTSAAAATVYLSPGLYWLVVRNTHASNTFIVNWTATGHATNKCQTKTLGSALGSTLDFVAATWTKQTVVFAVTLDGAVFGQTTAF